VLIDVQDDGPGCSENEYAVLTQRGVRLDESVSGHGLGLAIVADIVSAYRGSLRVGRSSGLGGGTLKSHCRRLRSHKPFPSIYFRQNSVAGEV